LSLDAEAATFKAVRKNFKQYIFIPEGPGKILKKYFSSGRSGKYYKKYFLSLCYLFFPQHAFNKN